MLILFLPLLLLLLSVGLAISAAVHLGMFAAAHLSAAHLLVSSKVFGDFVASREQQCGQRPGAHNAFRTDIIATALGLRKAQLRIPPRCNTLTGDAGRILSI